MPSMRSTCHQPLWGRRHEVERRRPCSGRPRSTQIAANSAAGGFANGVLGCETEGLVTLIQGWNWYTGADSLAVGANEYDFETVLIHEMSHALGLGHSDDASSVMYAMLNTGETRRDLTVADLAIPDVDEGPCPLVAGGASPPNPEIAHRGLDGLVQSDGTKGRPLGRRYRAPT